LLFDFKRCDTIAADPFAQAVLAGDCTAVEALLARTPGSLPMTPDGRTLLHLAARAGHERMVDLLVARGLQVSSRVCHFFLDRTEPWSPLAPLFSFAAHFRLRFADSASQVDAKDTARVTPLMIASEHGRTACATRLLDHGASIASRAAGGVTALHLVRRGLTLGDQESLVCV
jgi:ankyrin repeat protein